MNKKPFSKYMSQLFPGLDTMTLTHINEIKNEKPIGASLTLQAETQGELDTLMPSIMDRAFKGMSTWDNE